MIGELIGGLEKMKARDLARLAKTRDVNDALELRRQVERIDAAIVAARAVKRHLDAATEVRPPPPALVKAIAAAKRRLPSDFDALLARLRELAS